MVRKIEAQQLKDRMDAGEEIVLVDARAEEDYAADHLPGAVSLVNMDVEDRADGLLPKSVPVVVYSNDAMCPASGLLAEKLDDMGFGPVYDYHDSYADWVARGYPLESRSGV